MVRLHGPHGPHGSVRPRPHRELETRNTKTLNRSSYRFLLGGGADTHVGSVASRPDGVHHGVDVFAGVGRICGRKNKHFVLSGFKAKEEQGTEIGDAPPGLGMMGVPGGPPPPGGPWRVKAEAEMRGAAAR